MSARAPVPRAGAALADPRGAGPAFLGCGWSFPPTFDRATAEVAMAAGERDIRESLWIVLSTALGERVMLATFGCDLFAQVFATLTPTSAGAIAAMVANAIVDWEPRVVVERVAVEDAAGGDGRLAIGIAYRVIQTNTRSNLVFPFDRREATIAGPAG